MNLIAKERWRLGIVDCIKAEDLVHARVEVIHRLSNDHCTKTALTVLFFPDLCLVLPRPFLDRYHSVVDFPNAISVPITSM